MTQAKQWENEYRNSKLVTKHDQPQKFFLRYLKYLKKEKKIEIDGLKVLDLGSGTGRNTNYLAEMGAKANGIEISSTAVKLAITRAKEKNLDVVYLERSIGDVLPFENNDLDLIIDVTSSNSLNESERKIYLQEVRRILKPGGKFFVRALCKDSDKNAKNLLKNFPGKEYDTYIMPKINLVERVFTENDFRELYSKYFKIDKIIKETGYSVFDGRRFKRRFILGYFEKNNHG